jgi:trehalose 6-phosphate phosphatase
MCTMLFDAMDDVRSHIIEARHIFLGLDFDGTLTPLKPNPQWPRLSPPFDNALRTLAVDPAVSVAILTGRERADLQERVGIPGLIYGGNHGLEISGPGFVFIEPTAARYSSELKELAATLSAKLKAIPGALVENKGLTLSVHYRQVAESEQEKVGQIVRASLANKEHPFHLTMGAMVYEIRPRAYWSNGNAARWIMEKLAQPQALPIYMGDDLSDEEAFIILEDGITVRVGEPGETKAKYCLPGPVEVWKFLDWLTRRHEK